MRYGVTLAASVAAADGIWYLIQYGTAPPGCHVFRGEPEYPRHCAALLAVCRRGITKSFPHVMMRHLLSLLYETTLL
jgi:hypothetical protein